LLATSGLLVRAHRRLALIRRLLRLETDLISGLSAVLEFFVPGHLDGFEFAFVRGFGVAGEVGKLNHILVEVGEADGERVQFGVSFGQKDAEVLGVVPGELFWH